MKLWKQHHTTSILSTKMIDDSQDFRTFYFERGRKGSHLKIPKGLPFHLCRPGDQHRVLFEALVPCRTIRFPRGAAQCHTAAAVSTGPGIHTGVGCRGAWQREGASERQWKKMRKLKVKEAVYIIWSICVLKSRVEFARSIALFACTKRV